MSIYGISDLRNIGEGHPENIRKVHDSAAVTEALLVNGPAFRDFAGASVLETPEKALDASPIGHVDGTEPPFPSDARRRGSFGEPRSEQTDV